MDRLTRRMCGGWGLVEGCELNTPAGMRQVVERLAAYENTGMTPEMAAQFAEGMIRDRYLHELANFKRAQADGNIAILPKAAKSFKPVVSDDPQDNVSTALNLFYVKDGWTWVRGGGPAPDYADVSLCDYIRLIAKEHGLDMAEGDDDAISMEMAELLFDGTSTIDGIVATLYTAAWAFASSERSSRGTRLPRGRRMNCFTSGSRRLRTTRSPWCGSHSRTCIPTRSARFSGTSTRRMNTRRSTASQISRATAAPRKCLYMPSIRSTSRQRRLPMSWPMSQLAQSMNTMRCGRLPLMRSSRSTTAWAI